MALQLFPLFQRAALAPILGLVLAASAAGQLDLPSQPKKTPPSPGQELLPPDPPKGDLAPKKGGSPLELPTTPGAPGSASASPAAAPPAPELGPEGAARLLFKDLGALHELRPAESALEHLLALGPAGIAVARTQLGSAHAPTLLVAGRACLIAGSDADRAAVAERMTRVLPTEVIPALLAELLARDPVLASPEYLAALLDHPTGAMRNAVSKVLAERLSPALLPALAPLLTSSRTATRSAALELVARIPDEAANHLLASRLGDANAQLAHHAASALAARPDAEALLVECAFPAQRGAQSWDRAAAYALLGLIECEEARGRVLLDETRIEALRSGLTSEVPLCAGVCAVALAHVGFHLPASHTGPWLDRDVPHLLVRTGTGAVFHSDFSSLERPALRALALLSGESFGDDGEAWRHWWTEKAEGFRALHAVIDLPPGAGAELCVTLEERPGSGVWALAGSEVRDVPPGARFVLLDARAADELLAAFSAQGLFGAGRPAVRARFGFARALCVSVSGQSKTFEFAAGEMPSWFEPPWSEVQAVLEANRWQLAFDPTHTTQREWWQDQHERWAGLTPLEQRRELKNLLLASVQRATGDERSARLGELDVLYREVGVSEPADFEPLLALLAQESTFGPRAERLLELLRIAAGATSGAPGSEPAGRERLVQLGLERFGPEADVVLARIARDLGAPALRTLARDPAARARALAADGLLRSGGAEDHELVLSLLADPEPTVELAVLQALAVTPLEETRPLLVERVRSGAVERRTLALRALARLGGKDAFDVALEAMGEGDATLQRASAEALAELADPRGASLLASLLARGPASPLFESARRGLKRLGPVGIEECLRLARSASVRTRREAVLLLAESCVPEAAEQLLALLTQDPGDERVAWELAVLSGVDLRQEEHPEVAWWSWWALVVHDDPLAWLLAAAERAEISAPARDALEGRGTLLGARFLLKLLDSSSPQLVERAVRELERRMEIEIRRPKSAAERTAWRAELEEDVRARFGE